MRSICIAYLVFGLVFPVLAQVQSPEAFLGYPLGSRYTPHHQVINYFRHLAAESTSQVKLLQYGQTNEGRPLMVAFIASAENLKNLEEIRKNNLKLAGQGADNGPARENAPAIVWLSYNVHGNETSSSEASMLTAFELLNPANPQSGEWLKNVVVVIDPCINPDGRDRYVNWFNSVVGKNFNPRLEAREHREPWPGGRTNHYNFDLNRDWAWQTQVETRQRLKLYLQWLPQIHVDYHEQGINSPYYFAPAAQPYHERVTEWQRAFQVSIGKNNARYFDKNGWLFFTKEIFDLYYPSYGDTYPIYNGAIGMTYEQAGGGASGLGVYKKEGDTLTLTDRLMHHYTTGISTIEISAKNAQQLVTEFKRFFAEANSRGTGNYKTYVVKHDAALTQNIEAFLTLLDNNEIRYSRGSGTARGYNYASGKEESFAIGPEDILISGLQPKSTLIDVLFEPQPKLVDTATYDITAWALPYVYGLSAYAVKDKLPVTPFVKKEPIVNQPGEVYGYVIPWEGLRSARVAAQLLQQGVKLRFAYTDFEVNKRLFKRGALIVLKTSNAAVKDRLWQLTAAACNAQQVESFAVNSGFVDKGNDFGSSSVAYMKPPRIGLFTGEGTVSYAAGEVWFFMEQDLNYPVTLINVNDFGRVNWNELDVLIMPDGNYSFLSNKAQAGELDNWIRRGGKLIAMENAVAQLAKDGYGIALKKDEDDSVADKNEPYNALKRFGTAERDYISGTTPGAIYKVQLDNTHPLAFGYPDYYYTLKMDDRFYNFIEDGWNVGVIKRDNWVSGFVGAKLKKKLKDGVTFGVEDRGRGTVVYLTDDVLFRNFWQNGKLLFCNALFMVGQ